MVSRSRAYRKFDIDIEKYYQTTKSRSREGIFVGKD